MNGRDRAFLDRVDEVVREIGTLTPANPADIAAISGNLRIATAASKVLSQAIAAIRCQDWQVADERLREAERIVARPDSSLVGVGAGRP